MLVPWGAQNDNFRINLIRKLNIEERFGILKGGTGK